VEMRVPQGVRTALGASAATIEERHSQRWTHGLIRGKRHSDVPLRYLGRGRAVSDPLTVASPGRSDGCHGIDLAGKRRLLMRPNAQRQTFLPRRTACPERLACGRLGDTSTMVRVAEPPWMPRFPRGPRAGEGAHGSGRHERSRRAER
jgi:hypothetical protein